eukprot:12914357-Prorocentrum_lima.AAC.1
MAPLSAEATEHRHGQGTTPRSLPWRSSTASTSSGAWSGGCATLFWAWRQRASARRTFTPLTVTTAMTSRRRR